MNEQDNIIESGQENVNNAEDYIKALKEMKERSVEKSEYDKLKSENRQLLDALVNGKSIDVPTEVPVDVEKLRKELYGGDTELTNLEYVEKTLQLRKALMDAGNDDPFLPVGDKVRITNEMREQAQNVANVFQECVDFARGDSGVFTAELQRRTKDVMPRYGKSK